MCISETSWVAKIKINCLELMKKVTVRYKTIIWGTKRNYYIKFYIQQTGHKEWKFLTNPQVYIQKCQPLHTLMATLWPFFAKSTGLWLFSMDATRPISMKSFWGIHIGVPICSDQVQHNEDQNTHENFAVHDWRLCKSKLKSATISFIFFEHNTVANWRVLLLPAWQWKA